MRSFHALKALPMLALATLVACAGGGDDDDDDNTDDNSDNTDGMVDAMPVELPDAAPDEPDASEPVADADVPAADAAAPVADADVPAADAAAPVADADVPAADAAAPAADAAPMADGAPPMADAGLMCSVSTSDFGAKGALTTTAFFEPGAAGVLDDFAAAFAPLEGGDPADFLQIELYADFGAFTGGGITTGTFQLTGDETQYSTCGVCVRVLTNVDNATGNYEHDYLATSGTVTITQVGTAVGQQLAVSFSNVNFGHVTIDGRTFVSTPASACTTQVDSGSLSGTMQALP